jgi:hypothetical protein
MLHHREDGFDRLEEISQLLKQTHCQMKDPASDQEVNSIKAQHKNPELDMWLERSQKLLGEHWDAIPSSERELLTRKVNVSLPNLLEEAEMFEWAGVSFGEEETYKLQKALKKLAVLSGASALRFWGKVYGSERDYFVVEGDLLKSEEGARDPEQEPRGTGCNRFVYWVTDNVLSDWIQLPDTTPAQLNTARQIKHLFTGNLAAPVDSNPLFPGKERHYLRAQIARITMGTVITPKGIYAFDEETKLESFEPEGFEMPEDLKSLENWGHRHPMVLKCGRCTHYAPPTMTEEERDEFLAAAGEKDPVPEDKYRALNEEDAAKTEDAPPTWIVKVAGDAQPFNPLPGTEGNPRSYAVNVLKSYLWPGSITCSKNGRFQSIYVGDGLKRGGSSFNPTDVPEVSKDPVDDYKEQPEPTPLEWPKEPAPGEVPEGNPEEEED